MLAVVWIDHEREPRSKPNPLHPRGVDIDCSNGVARSCRTTLPYPARRCGMYLVTCDDCGQNAVISTAGRVDDPRSIKLACKVSP